MRFSDFCFFFFFCNKNNAFFLRRHRKCRVSDEREQTTNALELWHDKAEVPGDLMLAQLSQ